MVKRTRKAKNIKMYLSERTRYNPTSLEVIMSKSDHVKMDSDGDITGISDVGLLHSKIERVYNILENRHKVSFLELLKYQFTGHYKYNTDTIKTFVRQESKIVKEQEQANDIRDYEKYKKLSPDDISDIISRMFTKSRFEENVKKFEIIRTDILSKYLNAQEQDLLQKEEITHPVIEHLKLNITDGIYKDATLARDNRFTFTQKEAAALLIKGIKVQDYGFKKRNHLYKMRIIPSMVLQKYKGQK